MHETLALMRRYPNKGVTVDYGFTVRVSYIPDSIPDSIPEPIPDSIPEPIPDFIPEPIPDRGVTAVEPRASGYRGNTAVDGMVWVQRR